MKEKLAAFERLLSIMDELRTQCPWDKKQTIESLRYLTIEEVYELSDAIIDESMEDIRKELGDIMLHIVFYSRIADEKNSFDIKDVLDGISEKLIRRHPHIYGEVKVSNEEDVKNNWEKIKMGEGRKSVLGGVPRSLPAMVKALRIQEKARGIGFDWDNASQVWEKVKEEEAELHEALQNGDKQDAEQEFGDLLFALINYSRFVGVNPEDALEKSNRKFISRFQHLENEIIKDGKSIQEMNLEQMDVYWEKAKASEKK